MSELSAKAVRTQLDTLVGTYLTTLAALRLQEGRLRRPLARRVRDDRLNARPAVGRSSQEPGRDVTQR